MASWEKEYEKIKKQVEESTAKKKAAVQKIIQEQTDAAASAIEAQKRAVPSEYRRLYDASEVQRIVDQRNILNRMANIGATRSGLSDTLTTAVNLSAGNRVQALNAQQQAAIDKLTQTLTELQAKARADIASRQADIQSEADKYLADTRGALYSAYKQAEAARLEQQIKQQQLQYEQQQKLLQQQRDLILSLAANKITPEQYNAVAPLYGLQPIPATTTSTTTVNGQIGAFLPNSSGAPSTMVQMSGGSLYSGYTSDAIRTGQSVANAIKSGKMTKDQALDSIIMAYEDYSNADAMIELAAKTAGLSDLLKTREKQTLKK